MSEKQLPKLPDNKKRYIVTLSEGLDRVIMKYNPNAVKHFRDKDGNIIKTVKNDGNGYAYSIKLHNGEIKIFDVEKQAFMINNLVTTGKIKDYELYLTELENDKLLQDMEKESGVIDNVKTSDSEQVNN